MKTNFGKIFLFLVGIILGLLLVIYIFVFFPTTFKWSHGYEYYEIPIVRSCLQDADCRAFGESCVNNDFSPNYQNINSLQVPNDDFHERFSCECGNYYIMNLCQKKSSE